MMRNEKRNVSDPFGGAAANGEWRMEVDGVNGIRGLSSNAFFISSLEA